MYKSASLEKDKRLEQVINGEINKDIIVLGSSRGARDVIACQIEDSLHRSAFNLSYPGSDVEFHEFVLRSLLKFNKAPKVVMLVVDYDAEFYPSTSLRFRLDRMYPLVKYDYIYKEMIAKGEINPYLSRILVLSRINNANLSLTPKNFTAMDSIKGCGSMPISFQKKGGNFEFSENRDYELKKELPYKLESFRKIQKLCSAYGIKLYLLYGPNFGNYSSLFENRIKELASPGNSFYAYDTLNPIYKDRSYYFDVTHLQTKGAEIYTNELINLLRNDPALRN
jgi:hypothetical protein